MRPDPTGKAPGRGAYLHDQRSCWESGLRGALAKALRAEINPADRVALQAYLEELPESDAAGRAGKAAPAPG